MILSPLTKNNKVVKLRDFPKSEIVELYRSAFNISVEKYFEDIEVVSLMECSDTGFRFYSPESIAGDGEFYSLLDNVFTGKNYYPEWKYEYSVAKDLIVENAKVLDVGCGDGHFLNSIKDISKRVTGIDFSDTAIQTARKKGINVFKSTIGDFKTQSSEKYDVICAFQVLEHIVDVNSFLGDALELLEPNGLLIIGVPNNVPYLFGYNILEPLNMPPHHMGLWSASAFNNLSLVLPVKIKEIKYDKNPPILKCMIALATFWLYKFVGFQYARNKILRTLVLISTSIITFPMFLIKHLLNRRNSLTIVAVMQKND